MRYLIDTPQPGDLVRHDSGVDLILAVADGHVLALHITDGLSRSWLPVSAFDDGEHMDAATWLHDQRRKAASTAQAAIRQKGSDAAIREATRAGVWEALEHVTEVLRHGRPGGA